MATLLEQNASLQADVARLNGEITTLRGQFSAIPGGAEGVAALITARDTALGDVTRLTGEMAGLRSQFTTAQGEVTRLTAELATEREEVETRAETRAAAIVSSTGVEPARAETATAGGGVKPAGQRSYDEHWSHYRSLGAEEKNRYYEANRAAMSAK